MTKPRRLEQPPTPAEDTEGEEDPVVGHLHLHSRHRHQHLHLHRHPIHGHDKTTSDELTNMLKV